MPRPGSRRLSSPLIAIFLVVLVDILGFTLVIPLLPFYAEKYGGSPGTYGWIVTSYAICQLFSGPLLGVLSDRFGRKPLLLISQFGTWAGFLILFAAHSLPMIFLSRIVDGLTAGNLSIAQAYISDVTTPQNRAKSFGIIGISFGIGSLIGPSLSGFLSQFGFQYPPLAASVLSLASIGCTIFLLPTVQSIKADLSSRRKSISLLQWKQYAKFFRLPKLRTWLLQYFFFSFAFSMFITGFALFAERRFVNHGHPYGPVEVGYLLGYSGLLSIVIQGGLLGWLVRLFGEKKLIRWGFILMAANYVLLGLSSHLGLLLIAMAGASLGTGVLRPSLTSLITQTAARDEQGTVLGMNQTLMSIAQIFAPLLVGYLFDQHYLFVWALVTSVVCLLGLSLGFPWE